MNQASGAGSATVTGTALIIAAIVIAVLSNGSNQWAIGVPVALAVAGAGLRIEAAILARRTG